MKNNSSLYYIKKDKKIKNKATINQNEKDNENENDK